MGTDASPLFTVDELVNWMKAGPRAVTLAEKVAAPAWDLRQAVGGLYTSWPIGVYWHPDREHAALYVPAGCTPEEAKAVKAAVAAVAPVDEGALKHAEMIDSPWIKVAWSPTLRAIGENLNFFPGHIGGIIPNYASPITGALTSGLVGAGLGYGAGWLGEKLMPEKWEKGKLRRTLAIMGAMPGPALGLTMGLINRANGKPFNDAGMVAGQPGSAPQFNQESLDNVFHGPLVKAQAVLDKWPLNPLFERAVTELAGAWSDRLVKFADEEGLDTMSAGQPGQPNPLAINIDALGRTLWDTVPPPMAGTAVAAMTAAQHLPGGIGAGWVTPTQMAHLAAGMGAGYISGAIVGNVLGALAGMPPETVNTLKRTGMYAGVVEAVLPHLFGG